jgi:hypothetical protein
MADQEDTSKQEPRFGVGTIIQHRHLGRGRIVGHELGQYIIHFRGETKRVSFNYSDMEPVQLCKDPEQVKIREAVAEALEDYGWIETELEISSRWIGGVLKLIPGKEGTQPKEIPIDAFLKKIIGVREKLRVLEQKINNHPNLEQEHKIELEGYITRCYGSLTTFNVLFADKENQFRGEGS